MLTQTVSRKTRISDGLLTFFVIVIALAVVYGGGYLNQFVKFAYASLILYLIVVVFCCWFIIRRMTAYRYGADGKQFLLDRIVGRKEKAVERIHWKEIRALLPPGSYTKEEGIITHTGTVLKKESAYALCYTRNGRKYRILIHPNEEVKEKILEMLKK